MLANSSLSGESISNSDTSQVHLRQPTKQDIEGLKCLEAPLPRPQKVRRQKTALRNKDGLQITDKNAGY